MTDGIGASGRFRPAITVLAWSSVAAGALMVGIGLSAGLPWLWTCYEGPTSIVFGLLIVWLLRSVPRS